MNPTAILPRYIMRSFFKMFIAVTLCLTFIISMLELMEVMRRYFSNSLNISWATILELTAYHTVISVFSFFPFVVFLASIVFFTIMHWRLELTAMKIIGTTTLDILKALLVGASLLGAFYITVLDLFSAHSTNMIISLNSKIVSRFRKTSSDLVVTNRGVWLRDTYDDKSYIINTSSHDASTGKFLHVRLFEFNKEHELVQSIYSRSASISDGQWVLGKTMIATADGTEKTLDQMKIPTTISIEKIDKMATNPAGISFWNMGRYIDMLEHAGLSGARYRINWFMRLSSILQMVAFIVLATAACTNYNARNSKRYSVKVASLLAAAFPIYFLNNVIVALSAHGRMQDQIATCIMPLLTMLTGAVILARR
ncbi:MAG: LptF/LptG family permease [Holosporales bacterium]|jgi:lipopolysaccharide export system permease protein|nr:LptF/LptG family permease [Holosporales bacterium]